MLKLTPALNTLVKAALFFLVLGLALAGRPLVMVGLLLLVFAMLGLLLDRPGRITVRRSSGAGILFTGEVFPVEVAVEIRGGLGYLVCSDDLPGEFELVSGSNIALVRKGPGPKKALLRYEARSTTAGVYRLAGLSCESHHCLELQAPRLDNFPSGEKIEIRPRLMEVKKIRDVTTRSRIPLPMGAQAKMGISTLEFRELRHYQRGDPFKQINWKATARSGGRPGEPLVNECEKEGKKTVWLFLDRAPQMSFGSSARNAFECALEAVNGLTDYYLKHDCRVALSTYNGLPLFIYPAGGKRQYHKILRELLRYKGWDTEEEAAGDGDRRPPGLVETITRHRGYLYGSSPLCVILTRLTEENAAALGQGIREAMKYTVLSRERFSVLVINISGYDLAASTVQERQAAAILAKRDHHHSLPLRRGVGWIDWNPARHTFTAALLSQVASR